MMRRREQANGTRAENQHRVARADAAAVGGVKRDRRRVQQRSLGKVHFVGEREHGLDVVDDVLGKGSGPVVPVVAMKARVAVVLAYVVAALDTARAVSAGGVGGPGHPRSYRMAEALDAATDLDDLARPLVARGERPARWPEPRIVASQEMRIGAAD